jgi:hypothetical protein
MKVRDEEAGLEEGEEGYIQVGLWKRVTRENQRTWSVMEPYFGEEIAADDELDELVGEDEEEAEGDDAADKEDVEQSDKVTHSQSNSHLFILYNSRMQVQLCINFLIYIT